MGRSASVHGLRFIIRAKMPQTMRHSMPNYANAHVDVSTKKVAQALLLWAWAPFSVPAPAQLVCVMDGCRSESSSWQRPSIV